MELVQGLLAGIILGWLIEWVMDLYYWRRDDAKLGEKLAQAETQIDQLETKLAEAQEWKSQLQKVEVELNHTKAKANTMSTLLTKYTGQIIGSDPCQTIDLTRSQVEAHINKDVSQ